MTALVHEDEASLSYRPVFVTALAVMACLTVAGLGWGMFAHLDAAVVSHGVLLAESERKTVEHLEAGILDQLLVKPGDHVDEGQIVATLDATQPREQLAKLRADWLGLTFEIWRLAAEVAGATALDPTTAPEVPEPERSAGIAAQQGLFDARLRAHVGQIDSLRRQIDNLQGQIAANEAQVRSAEQQLKLWTEERASTASLVDKGATPKQKLLELDRTIASLTGDRDEYRGLVDAAQQDIARARADIETLVQQRLAESGQKLSDDRRAVAGLASQMRAAGDVLERHNLRAPQSGFVVDIKTKTPGAVIATGAPVMDIVPDHDRLVVQTKVQPDNIDTVHQGRPAKIRLTAYPRAISPVVTGEVIFVSADMLTDERDGSAYFDARISIDPESLQQLPGIAISAGMPVEVSIETGERRAGDYILAPLLRRIHHTFREE